MPSNNHEPREPFSLDELKAVLSYDPETGEFTSLLTGKKVGFVVKAKGYVCIGVLGKKCNAHRLAFLLAHGRWPRGEVDHVDGNKLNNRLANLREAQRSTNSQNQIRAHNRNRSGLLGVAWDAARGKWISAIFFEGRKKYLGRYDTPGEAHARYVEAKRLYHPGCTI